MKKIIKNILLAFAIIFTMLNIVGFIFNNINYYSRLIEDIYYIKNIDNHQELLENEKQLYSRYKEEYGQDSPVTMIVHSQAYFMGQRDILDVQLTILIISAFLSIAIGVIISVSEKSKIKQILLFIAIGLIIVLLLTTYTYLTSDLSNENFIEKFAEILVYDYIKPYGVYYIIGYLVIYVIKYFIAKNNAKILNFELKKRKEEKN